MDTTPVGVVTLVRPQFDAPWALQEARRCEEALREAVPAGVTVISLGAAQTAAELAGLLADRDKLELLVVIQGTFTDGTMADALAGYGIPLLFWALPEPDRGGWLRSNSLCGVNLALAWLRRRGVRAEAVYGSARSAREVAVWCAAADAWRRLRRLRLGLVGEPPAGFFSSGYSPFPGGPESQPVQITLDEAFARARAVDAGRVGALRESLARQVGPLPEEVEAEQVDRTLGGYAALRGWAEEQGLHAVAVECWPRFMAEYGGAICLGMGLMAEDGVPAACERDVFGAISLWLARHLTGKPGYLADLVAVDDDGSLVFWHCGSAAASLCRPGAVPHVAVHPNRRVAATWEFPLAPGEVTVARLSLSPQGTPRLTWWEGMGLDGPLLYHGNTLRVQGPLPGREILDRIFALGVEHHHVLAYGRLGAHLGALARLAGWEGVDLGRPDAAAAGSGGA